MSVPVIIYALPRSRTAWAAKLLTYRGYTFAHDQAAHLRSMEDARSWLSQDYTGAVETAAAPWWRIIHAIRPDIRAATIRRPPEEVVDSLMRVHPFDRAVLTKTMRQLDAKLDQIEARVPGILSVRFADLSAEVTCARLFEHCLPYAHDHDQWARLAAQNIQISVPAQMRYYRAHKTQLDNLIKTAKHQTIAGLARRTDPPDDVTIQEEPYEVVWKAGDALFAEHCVDVGEPPDEWKRKNIALLDKLNANGAWLIMTARSNGRLFGYLSSLLTQTLDSPTLIQATQLSLFVSADARGMNLPMRLERAALDAYRARGVGRVMFRAGTRGSGPKLGAVYRRLGAEDDSRIYRLDLPKRVA